MINGKRVLIVIPAWNEEASVADVVREVRGELPGVGVLVVDDGSKDRTHEMAAQAGATVARLPYNLGVGGAMRLGYRYGYENHYDVVIQIDADGQHDPRYVPKLVDALDDADFVIGARFAGEGDYNVHGPRKWAMTLLSIALSRMAHAKLTDTTSGFRAANRRTVELFAHWYPVEYLGDTIEVLVRLLRNEYRIVQVPVTMRPRQAGTPSHSPIKSTVYLARAALIFCLSMVRK
ncbi:glycosyltransferase family 2 protein [Rugosimonospora acidiphila]|uniref:Glycosyltransferase family 2 protein n=1 Tax=Rugosimonospora acidiphila TaxID=556531 RepID=A0ABP9RMA8_9ACTN